VAQAIPYGKYKISNPTHDIRDGFPCFDLNLPQLMQSQTHLSFAIDAATITIDPLTLRIAESSKGSLISGKKGDWA